MPARLSPAENISATVQRHGPPRRAGAILSLSLSTLLAALGTSIANVALPALATAFDASFQQVQWVVLGYLLGMTTLMVGVGRIGDIIGRRRLLLAGIALFTLASVLCGAAPTLELLVAARAVQGLGAAIMTALTLALVGESVPQPKVAHAVGILGTMSATGTALGPSLGGLLLSGFGWRAPFLAIVPLGALAFLLARRHLPVNSEPRAAAREKRFDYAGTTLLALALVAYALAMTLGRGRPGGMNLLLLLGAAGLIAAFARVEAQAAAPLVRMEMFRDPKLRASFALSGIVASVMMTTLVIGPFYLACTLELSPAFIGPALSVGPAVAALAGIPSGRATSRFGVRCTTVAGLLGMTAGTLAPAFLPSGCGLMGYLGSIAVITGSYALFQTANNTSVMADVPSDRRGVVSGLLNLARNLGLVTGASVMGAVFAFGAAATDVATANADAVAAGMRLTFGFAAGLILVALAIALRPKAQPPGPHRPACPDLFSSDRRPTRRSAPMSDATNRCAPAHGHSSI